MNIIRDVFKEIASMFLADAKLTLSILVLVCLISLAIKRAGLDPLIAGVLLLAGCLVILAVVVYRTATIHIRKSSINLKE